MEGIQNSPEIRWTLVRAARELRVLRPGLSALRIAESVIAAHHMSGPESDLALAYIVEEIELDDEA